MKLRIQVENKILFRQNVGAKIHIQEGNSPDYLLRSLKYGLVQCFIKNFLHSAGRLGSSHPLKKA